MSFHCSRTAWVGLTAALGGSFFFAVSCAITGDTANPMANARLASLIHFIMVSLLSFVPGRDAILIRRTTRQDVSRAMPRLGPLSYVGLPPSHTKFRSDPRVISWYFTSREHSDCEL